MTMPFQKHLGFFQDHPGRKHIILPAVFVLLVYLLPACTGNSSQSSFQMRAKSAFKTAVHNQHLPGAVMGVRTPEGKTLFFSMGYADIENDISMDTERSFRIGSVTKSFTATAVLMLADQGLLSLDDTADSLLPGQVPGGSDITVRMLLQMRSGLSEYTSEAAFQAALGENPDHAWTFDEIIALVSVEEAPDEGFAYRNINYQILGRIIEKLSGMTYGEYIRTHLLQPLGMNHTTVPTDAAMPPHSAKGYLSIDGTEVEMSEALDPSWGGPAGNIISTASDMLIWMEALRTGRLISEDSRQAMFAMRPGILRGGLAGYGFGVLNRMGAVGHGGNYTDIFTSVLFSYQDHDFVILANGYRNETIGDATTVFFSMIADLLPVESAGAWLDDQLDTLLSLSREYLQVPGIVAMAHLPGGREWTGSTGVAEADDTRIESPAEWTGTPMTSDLYFRIASITKSVTATAVLLLAQEGLLELDDTLDEWLPGMIATGRQCTLRQLLNHTSGIPDFIRNPDFFNLNFENPLRPWTLEERINYGVPLSEPGQDWAYSNTGYLLLALVAEQASGVSFCDLVRQRILSPLGLEHTIMPPLNDFSMPQTHAHGYTYNFNPMQGAPETMPEAGWLKDSSISNWQGLGYGDLISTPRDLMTWLKALTDGVLLTAEMRDAMHEYVSSGENHYGLGVEYKNGYAGHDGDLPGYHTAAYAKQDHLLVVLMNGDPFTGTSPGFFVAEAMGKLLQLKD